MNHLQVDITLMDEELEAPAYAHRGDAGLDLRSTVDAVIDPGERLLVPCGIAMAIPEGYAGLVIPRSGLAAKHGISIVNAPGLIDSGYRGEIMVTLVNLDPREPFTVARGDRIAQLMLVAVPAVSLRVVDALDESERGQAGFGSSGVA